MVLADEPRRVRPVAAAAVVARRDAVAARPSVRRTTRWRIGGGTLALVLVATGLVACGDSEATATVDRGPLDVAVETAMEEHSLRSLLVRITRDGEPVYEVALGQSLTGVPAATDMHFRNGSFGFTLMATLLLRLVDAGELSLDDPVSTWFPQLPEADRVTLRNLANMTSGYADYVYQPALLDAIVRYPFKQWTSDELIDLGVNAPMDFEPGTNWGYSHTNYVILGRVLEAASGMELGEAIRREVLVPMRTTGTTTSLTPEIPAPVLHSFSSERRALLGVPADVPFSEDSTFWNPSWTTAPGAVGTSTIADLTTIMRAVGTGAILSPESFREQTDSTLVGFGHTDPGCGPCRANTAAHNYSLGNVNRGAWVTQTKDFAGNSATAGYLPDGQIAVAVVTTYRPEAFGDDGELTATSRQASAQIFDDLVTVVAPGSLQDG